MNRWLHYHKIVQNEIAVSKHCHEILKSYQQQAQGYPEEWFPSVSATIGDRYPERSVFMLFIALTSGTFPDKLCLTKSLTTKRSSIRTCRPLVYPDPPT